MTTTITRSFQTEEGIDHVWSNISNPERLVTCLPGASLTETVDDKNYKGKVVMKFGPVKAKYNGLITFEELDSESKIMKMIGKGLDSKGKGSADMKMNCKLSSLENGGTSVDYTIDISITGLLAQFGARLITDVTHSVFDEFTANFKGKLKGEEVDNSMSAGKMMGTVVKSVFGGGKKNDTDDSKS